MGKKKSKASGKSKKKKTLDEILKKNKKPEEQKEEKESSEASEKAKGSEAAEEDGKPEAAEEKKSSGGSKDNKASGTSREKKVLGVSKDKKPLTIPKRKKTLKEKIIITAAIIGGIILLAVMILFIPFIRVERPDGTVEHINIIQYIKEMKPLVEIEGELAPNSMDLQIDEEKKPDDKREFTNGQIVEGQYTVLVLGFDESRELSDVNMLFLFDIHNKKLNILQIPRDSFVSDLTFSETGKFNSIYSCGNPDVSPIQRTVDAVGKMFKVPIDSYVTLGCKDIIEIVDLMGGIPINLPENIIYSYDKVLYAGEQVLDGQAAELMVRARMQYDEGDIGRVKAQRLFLTAAFKKALDMGPVEMESLAKKTMDKKLIATDLAIRDISILADFASLIDLDKITVQLVPGEGGDHVTYNGYSVWSIHKKATADMLNKYFRPYQIDIRPDQLEITELVEEGFYLTDRFDENQDTFKEIDNGVKPGESKKDPATTTSPGYNPTQPGGGEEYVEPDPYPYYPEPPAEEPEPPAEEPEPSTEEPEPPTEEPEPTSEEPEPPPPEELEPPAEETEGAGE